VQSKTIFFDLDGVLNTFGDDFISYVKYYYKNSVWEKSPYGYDLSKWFHTEGNHERHHTTTVFSDPLFWRNLHKNNKIYTEMEEMDLYSKHFVYVCTLPFGWSFCPSEKEEWLKRNYPKINTNTDIVMLRDKHLLASNGILIDDSPDNIRKFMNAGGEAYLYKTFYNYKEDLPKIRSLHELEEYL